NSNEPPLESDLYSINSLLSKTAARFAYLDEEMSRLWARMESLEEERASLSGSAYHSRNIGIFSLLRRMPPELTSEIFSWTLPSIMDSEASCSSAECWR
ncbi:hypothetical protein DFH07DRAFT_738963, partial [Mycena maculata]